MSATVTPLKKPAAKKAGRPRDPRKQVEARVSAINESISKLTKLISANAEKLTAEEVNVAYSFLTQRVQAGAQMANAALIAPTGKLGFKLGMELAGPAPALLVSAAAPGGVVTPLRPLPPNVVIGLDGKPEGRLAGATVGPKVADDEDMGFIGEDD